MSDMNKARSATLLDAKGEPVVNEDGKPVYVTTGDYRWRRWRLKGPRHPVVVRRKADDK